jgi:hypothetical protein
MAGGPKTFMPPKIIWTILNWEESNMRSIAFVLATFVASAPAVRSPYRSPVKGYNCARFSIRAMAARA